MSAHTPPRACAQIHNHTNPRNPHLPSLGDHAVVPVDVVAVARTHLCVSVQIVAIRASLLRKNNYWGRFTCQHVKSTRSADMNIGLTHHLGWTADMSCFRRFTDRRESSKNNDCSIRCTSIADTCRKIRPLIALLVRCRRHCVKC